MNKRFLALAAITAAMSLGYAGFASADAVFAKGISF